MPNSESKDLPVSLPRSPHPPGGCPVIARGIDLRDRCTFCDGRPKRGQIRLATGSCLFRAGETATRAYPLVSGFVRELRVSRTGERVGLRVIAPGEVIGVDAIWSGVHGCTAEAVTSVTVCEIPITEVMDAMSQAPRRVSALGRLMASHIDQLRDAVERLDTMSGEERLLAFVDDLATDRPAGTWVRIPIPRAQLAEHLGLAVATASRLIQRLSREGTLEIRGRLVRRRPQ